MYYLRKGEVLKTMAARGLVNGRDCRQRMSSGHSCLSSRALARRSGPAPKEWEGFSF